MTIVKRIFFGVLLLLLLAIIFCLIVVKVEEGKTSYLQVKNNPTFSNTSYIIKNVNIIPMTSDTVLRQMNVQVVDGIIRRISKKPVQQQASSDKNNFLFIFKLVMINNSG